MASFDDDGGGGSNDEFDNEDEEMDDVNDADQDDQAQDDEGADEDEDEDNDDNEGDNDEVSRESAALFEMHVNPNNVGIVRTKMKTRTSRNHPHGEWAATLLRSVVLVKTTHQTQK